MEILAIVPARGGSKSIPQKNIRVIGGRPLLAYTAESALSSRKLSRVILSTDDEEIAGVGRSLGLEVPFLRPDEFARDQSPAIDVIRHALLFLNESEGYVPEAVAFLQPTSPLRRSENIDEAVEILQSTGAESVVSVEQVPHQFNPVSVMRIENGRLTPFHKGELITRRQDKPEVFARNGPAIIVTRTDVLRERNSLYGEDSRPLLMGRDESIDVDGFEDLEYVEYLLTRRTAA